MIKAIKQYSFSEPRHWFFIWVELPNQLNTLNLFNKSLKEGVAFMPSHVFTSNASTPPTNGLRLNFYHYDPTMIEKGLAKLG